MLLLLELADLRHVNETVSVLGASYLEDLIKVSAAEIKAVRARKGGLYHVGFASLALLLDDEEEPWQDIVKALRSLVQ